MQAATFTFSLSHLPLKPPKSFSQENGFSSKLTSGSIATRSFSTKAISVNYNSAVSVFPAEACETIGGDACLVEMCREVRLQPAARNASPRIASENVEREYLEYNDPKTVFRGEACDDLGGLFCEREYQRGVY